MKEQLLKKGLLLGAGIVAHAQDKTEKFVKELIKKGHINKTEGKKLAKKVYVEAEKSRKKITIFVEKDMKKLLKTTNKAVKKKTTKKKTVKKKTAKKKR